MDRKKLVGTQLKKARKEAGYTQEELAKKMGLSTMMISRYEVGLNDIPIDNLHKLSKILEKTIAYFYGEENPDSDKIWEEAKKKLKEQKEAFEKAPKDMLAFSLGKGGKKREAVKEAKILMKNWYIAHEIEKETKKSFEDWWEGK